MSYAHVLVAYDGTEKGDAAVRAAARLARQDGAQLTVAAVVEVVPVCRCCARGGISNFEWTRMMCEIAAEELERARPLLDGPANLTVLSGAPGRALAEGAERLACDAIVVPAPSRAASLAGGLPIRVLRRRAHCAVLQLS